MKALGGHPSGFDYLRITLASLVIIWHSFGTSYGLVWTYKVEDSFLRPLVMFILPMFFATSGFLVAGSLARSTSAIKFIGLRLIRILPALITLTMLTGFLIGPFMTSKDLYIYFHAREFWTYLLTAVGFVHNHLPGVFPENPFPGAVNSQLNSVSNELFCYFMLTAIATIGLTKHPISLLCLTASCMILFFLIRIPHSLAYGANHNNIGGLNLALTFMSGASFYVNRQIIPWSGRLACAAGALAYLLFLIPSGDHILGLPLSYVTIYLGLLNPKRTIIIKGDYSYGLYLYGFVIQQCVANSGAWTHHWYINAPVSMFLACALATLSWHLVEKPAFRLKALLPSVERAAERLPRFKTKPKVAATVDITP
jgi:peptidoglycan/LPS O-acetylase OafA/YrhL